MGKVPAEVVQAAKNSRTRSRGIVAYEAEGISTFDMMLTQLETTFRARVISQDGRNVSVDFESLSIGDRPGTQQDKEKWTKEILHIGTEEASAIDEKYLDQFVYARSACSGCVDGQTAYDFKAVVRDENHSDGTLYIDKSGNVQRVVAVPCVSNSHFTEFKYEQEYMLVADNIWVESKSASSMSRSFGPFSISLNSQMHESGHQHFDDLATARAAVGH